MVNSVHSIGKLRVLEAITVVVPTRNEARNIPAFLASIPSAVRVIAVDASTDATPEIIARRSGPTRVLRHPGRVATARHIGAGLVETPWMLCTDADVVFDSAYFERLARRIAVTGGPAAWYGPKLSADAHGAYYRAFAAGQRLADGLGVPAVSGSNSVLRVDVYRAVGGFDLGLSVNEDSELGWRIRRAGHAIRFAPELVVVAGDHRRLAAGRARKTLHSLARCALLYTGLLPERWRASDWGYWDRARSGTD